MCVWFARPLGLTCAPCPGGLEVWLGWMLKFAWQVVPKQHLLNLLRPLRPQLWALLGNCCCCLPLMGHAMLLLPQFEYSGQLWPWSGYLALYIRVKEDGREFEGAAAAHAGSARPPMQALQGHPPALLCGRREPAACSGRTSCAARLMPSCLARRCHPRRQCQRPVQLHSCLASRQGRDS